MCWAQLLLLDDFWLHKNPISWGRGERMTLRLGYLQWLWEDSVKSLLCFIWSQLNLSCITKCISTSPGNVLTTGLLAMLGSFPNQFLSISLKLSRKILPRKCFVQMICFPQSISVLRNQDFLSPCPQKNGKTQTPLVGRCLTNTSTELWWGQLPTCLLPAFVSFYFKTASELLFWQEIAKKPKLHLNSAAACTEGSFEIIFI